MATTLVVRQNKFNLTEYDYEDSLMMKPHRALSLEVLNEAGNVSEDIPEDSQGTDYSLSDIEDGLEIDKSAEVLLQNSGDVTNPISSKENFANYCMDRMGGMDNDFSFDYSFNEETKQDSVGNTEEFSSETSTASASPRSSALSSSVWSLGNSRRGSETSALSSTKKTSAIFTKKGIMHIINLFENTDNSRISKSDIRVLGPNTVIDKKMGLRRSKVPSDVVLENDHKTGLLIGHKKHLKISRQRSKSQGSILDSGSTDRTADKNNNNNDPLNFTSLSHTVNRDRMGHAVAQWKHYKIAMETYRRSAEKAATDKNKTASKDHSSKTSTPEPTQQSKTQDFSGSHTLPRSSAVLSFSGSSRSSEERRNPGIINSDYSPICPDWQTPVSPQYTTLDYKTILRRTRSKRLVARALIPSPVGLQVDQNVFVEDNPDTVTDIDDFLGICDGTKKALSAMDQNSPISVVVKNTSPQQKSSPEELRKGSPSRVACKRKSPEKIVWSGYTKLMDEKKRCEETAKNGFLTRLERKNLQKNIPVNTCGSNDTSTENNLRRNALISKRNRSLNHNYIYLDPSTHNGCNMAYSMREYHTVASPGRLSRLSKMKNSINEAVSSGSTLSQSKKFWKLADKKSQLELTLPESRSHSRSLDDRRHSEDEGDDEVFFTSYHDRKSLLRKFKAELRVKNSFKRGNPIDIAGGDNDIFPKTVKKPPSPSTFSNFRSALQNISPSGSPLRRGGLKLLKSSESKGRFLLDLTKSARKSLKSPRRSPKQATQKSRMYSDDSNDIYFWAANKNAFTTFTSYEDKEPVPNVSYTLEAPHLEQSTPSPTDAYDIISSYTSSFQNNPIENDATVLAKNDSSRTENGENHETVTSPDAEGDYVNFDEYYKNKRISRFEIDDILTEDMSKLDLNIEEYFSFLGGNKLSPTTPVHEPSLTMSVADKSKSKKAQKEPETVDEIMKTITESSFGPDQESDTISRKPKRHRHHQHRRRRSVRCSNVPSYVPDYIKPTYALNKNRRSSARYQLTLNKNTPANDNSLKIASTFIKRPSIQQLGAIPFRENAKTWSGRMIERKKIHPGRKGRIGSISLAKLLRSNGIKLSLGRYK